MKRLIWSCVALLVFLASCSLKGFNDTGPIAYQTEILDAYAIPKTVAPGDTTQFVCIIADSTNNKYKFYWYHTCWELQLGEKKYINWYRNICYFGQSN